MIFFVFIFPESHQMQLLFTRSSWWSYLKIAIRAIQKVHILHINILFTLFGIFKSRVSTYLHFFENTISSIFPKDLLNSAQPEMVGGAHRAITSPVLDSKLLPVPHIPLYLQYIHISPFQQTSVQSCTAQTKSRA